MSVQTLYRKLFKVVWLFDSFDWIDIICSLQKASKQYKQNIIYWKPNKDICIL